MAKWLNGLPAVALRSDSEGWTKAGYMAVGYMVKLFYCYLYTI